MTDFKTPRPAPALRPEEVVCRDSLGRVLLELAARAAQGRSGTDLDRVPLLGRHAATAVEQRVRALAEAAVAEAVPEDAAGLIDADKVASWIVAQYPAAEYPAVVLGSPHGAAVHLAAAMGAPWLPTTFTVNVHWPAGNAGDWAGAGEHGRRVAARISAANPATTVRQIHDPLRRGPLCGSTVTLQVRWSGLPAAYRGFLRNRLDRGATSILVRDTRTWPVADSGDGHTFQIGSPANGWDFDDYRIQNPSFRHLLASMGVDHWTTPDSGLGLRYAETAGDLGFEQDLLRTADGLDQASYRVLCPRPDTLSACVADTYRHWMRALHGAGRQCVVETGGLLDPGQVLASGMVPYWCETASRRAAGAAEWWLAGSRPFESVIVLPQPPGTDCDANAGPGLWRSMSRFARRHPFVDRVVLDRYPLLPVPTSRAASTLAVNSGRVPSSTMSAAYAVSALRNAGAAAGMLVL